MLDGILLGYIIRLILMRPFSSIRLALDGLKAAVSFTRMQRLPIEIMTYIANSLDLHDTFNLSLTNAPYSADVQDARSSKQYARCLRRLVKIQNAVATAAPYSAAIAAHADDFIYCDGMLCYTQGYESLRLLHLHGSADSEIVIDIRTLLLSIPGLGIGNSKFKFRPVHFACGIVSCLYNPPKTGGRSRLVIIDVRQRKLLTAHVLESTSKLFARNNKECLYYGTHSMIGDDGFKRWVLRRFDICKEQWAAGRLDLEDLVGSDVGSTVCFEVIDNNFYGISSLNTFDVYEADWTSHYCGFRLPVGSLEAKDMQLTSENAMWRRQHEEGPIDDRWSTLQLEKDQVTGNIMVSECRREWLVDECSSTRTSYRTELIFSNRRNRANDSDSDSDPESDAESNEVPPTHSCSTGTVVQANKQRESSTFHRGDDGSTTPAITLSQCFIRSYNHSCETFIDLVNDPVASDSMMRRPQLRSISRFSHARNNHGLQWSPADGAGRGDLQPCTLNKISWWPPKTDTRQKNVCLSELDSILNPKGHNAYSPISGVMDDRSIVYAVGPRAPHSTRPLVFISFDPAIRLPNLNNWPGGPTTPPRTQSKAQGDDVTSPCHYPTPQSLPVSGPASRNSSFSEGSYPGPRRPSPDIQSELCKAGASTWIRRAPAAYLQRACTPGKPFGYDFAYSGHNSASSRS
ncbi:F-box domain-containing protein [Colletotrichum higginsianum IMI 349063]|uniref:F-box domain-containing protein n=1 Tax=Colletotrichum higginsianum (strain IMI 349063) TaxID=759273 RepID=A0A1B7Y634_COLHI|nr:F-box domain-containing protein [Colletotrichum higginsianum IMI 349063]OBR07463.1 F-box domain-containing protein [Colletotrichum higginsianum IMI 349063]